MPSYVSPASARTTASMSELWSGSAPCHPVRKNLRHPSLSLVYGDPEKRRNDQTAARLYSSAGSRQLTGNLYWANSTRGTSSRFVFRTLRISNVLPSISFIDSHQPTPFLHRVLT